MKRVSIVSLLNTDTLLVKQLFMMLLKSIGFRERMNSARWLAERGKYHSPGLRQPRSLHLEEIPFSTLKIVFYKMASKQTWHVQRIRESRQSIEKARPFFGSQLLDSIDPIVSRREWANGTKLYDWRKKAGSLNKFWKFKKCLNHFRRYRGEWLCLIALFAPFLPLSKNKKKTKKSVTHGFLCF